MNINEKEIIENSIKKLKEKKFKLKSGIKELKEEMFGKTEDIYDVEIRQSNMKNEEILLNQQEVVKNFDKAPQVISIKKGEKF